MPSLTVRKELLGKGDRLRWKGGAGTLIYIPIRVYKKASTMLDHRGWAVRGLLLQDKSFVDKPYTATSCTTHSLLERSRTITQFSRTCAEKIDKLGDAGAVIPSYVKLDKATQRAPSLEVRPTWTQARAILRRSSASCVERQVAFGRN